MWATSISTSTPACTCFPRIKPLTEKRGLPLLHPLDLRYLAAGHAPPSIASTLSTWSSRLVATEAAPRRHVGSRSISISLTPMLPRPAITQRSHSTHWRPWTRCCDFWNHTVRLTLTAPIERTTCWVLLVAARRDSAETHSILVTAATPDSLLFDQPLDIPFVEARFTYPHCPYLPVERRTPR